MGTGPGLCSGHTLIAILFGAFRRCDVCSGRWINRMENR